MSKINEKMKEVNENVVDVETAEVKGVENETEEFMTVRIPKAKAYEMLANGEAEEADIEAPEKEEVKEKKSIFSRLKNSKVAKGIAITAAAVVGGVVTGVALGKNNKNSDDVTFEDVPPQGLPDNNYQTYDEVNVETENEEV